MRRSKHHPFSLIRSLLFLATMMSVLMGTIVVADFGKRLFDYRDGWASEAPGAAARDMILDVYHQIPHPLDHPQLLRAPLPVYELKIRGKDLDYLRHTADLVSAARYSTGITREYVPAKFRLPDRWIDIEVKLRGKTSTHYSRNRPSLRLEFPKTFLFDGKRQINLCLSTDKGITKDVTTQWELERYGIMSWDHRFVTLKVNDEVVGVFQEIEQFSRSMIDRASRTEGFIFGGDGEIVLGKEGDFAWERGQVALRWFMECATLPHQDDPSNVCTWETMQTYLDIDRMAWATAMTTLLGSSHGWASDNIRLYYDPARGKLEPIPWDYLSYKIDPREFTDGETATNQGASFLSVPEFRMQRDQRLWVLLTERLQPMIDYAEQLYADLSRPLDLDHRSPKFQRELEIHTSFIKALKYNASLLKSLYQQPQIHVCSQWSANGDLEMALRNYGKPSVRIEQVVLDHDAVAYPIPLPRPVVVDGAWKGDPGTRRISIPKETIRQHAGAQQPRYRRLVATNLVTAEPLGEEQVSVRQFTVKPTEVTRITRNLPRLPENVRVDGNHIVWGPGPVQLSETLEISSEYDVRFEPGLHLTLGDSAALIVHGDLLAIGTETHPIQIHGSTSNNWGALVVQGERLSPSRVDFQHVTMRGGTMAENARCIFTGAFSVTDGIVTMNHCQLTGAAGIDGINFKYCQVDMQDNLVANTIDDSVDLDFCTGSLVGNRVVDSGGDGIDFSGSNVDVQQNAVERCADKGISVGENTRATIRDNLITFCRIGVACKDASEVTMTSTGLAHMEIGIALYRKKLTFGKPKAHVSHIAMVDVATAFSTMPDSILEFTDGVRFTLDERGRSTHTGLTIVPISSLPSRDELPSLLSAGANQTPHGIGRSERIPH